MASTFNLDDFEALPSAALQRLAERAEWELQGIRHQQQGLYDVQAVDRQIDRLLEQCGGRPDRMEDLADAARQALTHREFASFDTSRIRGLFGQGNVWNTETQPTLAGTAAYGRGEGGPQPERPDYGRMEIGDLMGEPVTVAAQRSPVALDGIGNDVLEGTPRQETGATVEAEPSARAETHGELAQLPPAAAADAIDVRPAASRSRTPGKARGKERQRQASRTRR